MTLPDRATVQQVARPQFQAMLDQQGRPVLIRRAGQPDVPATALLVPVTGQTRQGERAASPEFGSLPWKVFFRHDVVDVREPGFTIVAPLAQGQPPVTLTPTGPTVDLADQGVALLVVCTPLEDRTRAEILTFQASGTGLVQDPDTGNWLPAPGAALTVPARLHATADPRVRDMAGADAAEVVLIGRWGSLDAPQARPEGVQWGSESPLTLDGQPGTLTVKLAYPDADLHQEVQFGARFVALWRAG